jgi:hypothetical protein
VSGLSDDSRLGLALLSRRAPPAGQRKLPGHLAELCDGPGMVAKEGREKMLALLRRRSPKSAGVEQRQSPSPFDGLEPSVASEVASRWTEPCEGAFEYLSSKHPDNLLRLIESGTLADRDLTFAAEIAGRIDDDGAVRRALLPLLSHPAAFVREGAIYGLAAHVDALVRAHLTRLAADDSSAAVRNAAADALDEG